MANDNIFERNEDCATVFLKWTPWDFVGKPQISYWPILICSLFMLSLKLRLYRIHCVQALCTIQSGPFFSCIWCIKVNKFLCKLEIERFFIFKILTKPFNKWLTPTWCGKSHFQNHKKWYFVTKIVLTNCEKKMF